MQRIVIDEPYQFVPAYRGKFWSHVLRYLLPRHLRKSYGVVSHEVRNIERLTASLQAGDGVILAPNHCRLSDPVAVSFIARAARCHMYAMASWHTFKNGWFTGFMARRLGGFSVYREGTDRQALDFAIESLTNAERPLVVFPEGHITRHNRILAPLQNGVEFVARMAARRRERLNPPGKVVVHPVSFHYELKTDVETALDGPLQRLEERFGWAPQKQLALRERILKIGEALLALREIEYFGQPQTGALEHRRQQLIERMLRPLEQEWLQEPAASDTHSRVKAVRAAILPDMAANAVSPEERKRRWSQLRDAYYADQVSLYPEHYLGPECPPEHLLETVERYIEDLTDDLKPFGDLHLRIDIGTPIPVESKRHRGERRSPLMTALQTQLQDMLDTAARELAEQRGMLPYNPHGDRGTAEALAVNV